MNRDWRRGRWSAGFDPYGLNVPSIRVYGEGDDYAFAVLQYGSPGSDPVIRLEVDLAGTWLGRKVCSLAHWWRRRG